MEDKNNKAIESDSRVYEVGFHIVPTVVEENLGEQTLFIKESVAKAGGEVISEGPPSKMRLAYKIDAELGGDKKTFDTSYFGWIKFELPGEKLDDIKKAIESKEDFLRHLIVKTVREDTLVPRETFETRSKEEEQTVVKTEEPRELTEDDKEAIDRSIEELVSEE